MFERSSCLYCSCPIFQFNRRKVEYITYVRPLHATGEDNGHRTTEKSGRNSSIMMILLFYFLYLLHDEL